MKSLWNGSVRPIINASRLLYSFLLRKQNILRQQHITEVFNSDTSPLASPVKEMDLFLTIA